MGYRHGIYISELATSITPPVQVSAGLIVAFGTTPVNQLEDPASAVNKPIIAYTYAEAVSKIGYSTNFEKYTLSEVIKVAFGIYGVAPVVFINVLDPAKHKKDVTDEVVNGFAPIFPDICYHLTHYKPAAADIPVASDNPAHYADAIRYNARTPLQGSLLPLTRLVWA